MLWMECMISTLQRSRCSRERTSPSYHGTLKVKDDTGDQSVMLEISLQKEERQTKHSGSVTRYCTTDRGAMPLVFYSKYPLVNFPTRAQVEQNMKLSCTQGLCSHPCIL